MIAHATEWARKQGHDPLAVCCIYATAPFVQKDDIIKGLERLETGAWEYVFSATNFGFPIFRGFEQQAELSLEMFFSEYFQTRSQDLPEAMHDAGQFYLGRPNAWINGLKIFDKGSTVIDLPRWRVQDIDTMDDWNRAEIIFDLLKKFKECI